MRSSDYVTMQMEHDDPQAGLPAPQPTPPEFAAGDRVRMNALGRSRHPRYGERQAVVVRKVAANGWRVLFEGRTSLLTIHRDYLEKVEPA